MKTKILLFIMAIMSLAFVVSSCSEHDEDPGRKDDKDPVVKEESKLVVAGKFKLINLALGEEVELKSGTTMYVGNAPKDCCYGGDTVMILFEPQEEYYQSFPFDITVKELQKLNDSLFIFPKDLSNDEIRVTSIPLTINSTCDRIIDDVKYSLSATQKSYVPYLPKFKVDVEYRLVVSADLLQFVNPQISYKDDDENLIIINPSNTDWTQDSVLVELYQNQDGKTKEWVPDFHEETIGDEWTKIDEYYHMYDPEFSIEVQYTKRNTTRETKVTYAPKSDFLPSKEIYDFNHSFRWYSVGYININIDLTDHNVSKDAVASYITKLQSTPDIVMLAIDKYGKLTEKK